MLPHGHFAVGYLVYAGCTRFLPGRPARVDLLFLLLGTQFPDLLDKPLSLFVGGVFAGGRTLGHSLLFALPILLLVGGLVYRQCGRTRPTLAFGVGYLTHPFGDVAPLLVQGSLLVDLREISFLVWPLRIPAADLVALLARVPVLGGVVGEKAAWTAATLPTVPFLYTWIRVTELCLLTVAVFVWIRDGAPGLTAE